MKKSNIAQIKNKTKPHKKWIWKLITAIIVGVIIGVILLAIEQEWFSKKEITIQPNRKPKLSVGGLVGHAGDSTKITNSSFEGTIIINGDTSNVSVGGLVGSADSTVIIDSSKSKSKIILNPKK